jgi:hypothetical protein
MPLPTCQGPRIAGKAKLLKHPKASDDVDEELITPGAKKNQPIAQKKPVPAKVRPSSPQNLPRARQRERPPR